MSLIIHKIPLGIDNCYVLEAQDQLVVIDAGMPGSVAAFKTAMAYCSLPLDRVRLIILTHGHWDHIGSAADLQRATGARLAIHASERDRLEQALTVLPPGVTAWGRVFVGIMSVFMPLVRLTPVKADLVLGDDGLSLEDLGIQGRVIHTPGHSPGSMTVLLSSGVAFVGDLAMNGFPLRRDPGLPILADDLEQVKRSWRLLLDAGARWIYPAHGRAFSAEVMRRALEA